MYGRRILFADVSARVLRACRGLILPLLGGLAGESASASAPVLPPQASIDGRSAEQLTVQWWQWALAAPDDINPVMDLTGAHCAVGQRGQVWFLAGGFGSSKIRRTCTVPAARHLMFPLINMAYWPQRGNDDMTCEDAKGSAALNNDTAIDLFAEIDGVVVTDLRSRRIASTTCFDAYARARGAYRAYPAASDGYWLQLKPLPPGRHVLKFGGRYNRRSADYGRMVQDIEYVIDVR
ncbi:MAG: hypothetical protein EPO12_15110 [Aquabacterium sp.]|nr:MAG: hypothetical protein EPO12_15110 [Aquabacterium sp.]